MRPSPERFENENLLDGRLFRRYILRALALR